MKKTITTTAGFIRKLTKSDFVCNEWKDLIKEQYPLVFEKKTKVEKKLIEFGDSVKFDRHTYDTSGGIGLVGVGVAPEGLERACLVLGSGIEIKVDKRKSGDVVSFYRREFVDKWSLSDSEDIEVSTDMLVKGYGAAVQTLRQMLVKEFGIELFETTSPFNFNFTHTISDSSLRMHPLFITNALVPPGVEKFHAISFNEYYYDVEETKDSAGNRCFVFRRKIVEQ